MNPEMACVVELLKGAIEQSCEVEFMYGGVRRVVQPWVLGAQAGLVSAVRREDESLCLIGEEVLPGSSEEGTLFLVSRMGEVAVSGSPVGVARISERGRSPEDFPAPVLVHLSVLSSALVPALSSVTSSGMITVTSSS